jgi:peptidoglycan-associated lipoprotein
VEKNCIRNHFPEVHMVAKIPASLRAAPLAALLAVAGGCAHQPPPPPPPPPAAEPAPPPAAKAPEAAAPAPAACTKDDQCGAKELCIEGSCRAITPSLAACGLARVHFDFDSDGLKADEFPILQRAARCIEANNPTHVLITGNADERGTVEYNLALGQRRAAAVRKYIAQLGIAAAKLDTVSYGKEMPLCAEHDEACWRQNRRSAIRPNESAQDGKAAKPQGSKP